MWPWACHYTTWSLTFIICNRDGPCLAIYVAHGVYLVQHLNKLGPHLANTKSSARTNTTKNKKKKAEGMVRCLYTYLASTRPWVQSPVHQKKKKKEKRKEKEKDLNKLGPQKITIVVEHLPSKCETLSSNSTTTKETKLFLLIFIILFFSLI
jgi:hypothetical protein